MDEHIKNECGMKKLICNECKENVLRKDMDKHKTEICSERIGECPFSKYGCNQQVKAKDMDIHLTKQEMYHLKQQVKYQGAIVEDQ